jgi:hypothetical protein
MPSKTFYRDLFQYASWRFEQLDHCKCEIENRVREGVVGVAKRSHERQRSGLPPDRALGAMWYQTEYTLGNTFRYALLVGICSVVEETLNTIADRQFPGEPVKGKGLNWLGKHLALFATQPGFMTTDEFKQWVADFDDIITLRNCICHNWGSIAKDDHPEQVRAALERIAKRADRQNTRLAEQSRDDYLYLGDNMTADVLCLAHDITEDICEAMKRTVP